MAARPRDPLVVALVAVVLAAACSGAPAVASPPGGSDPPGAGVASADPAASAPAPSGPGGSPAPGSPGEGLSAPEPLPEPTLTDPFAIGEALYDPTRQAEAVVSVLDLLQVGIYAADGTPIRPGAEQDADDLWLTEDEVRGLIAMGEADAAALGGEDGSAAPMTVADLHAALAPMLPADFSAADFAAAYDEAYSQHPDELIAQVLLNQPITPETPLTRTQAWFLYVDGFVAPTGLHARRPSMAVRGSSVAPRSEPQSIGRVTMPILLSPDPSQWAQEWGMVMAHLPLLGFSIPFEITPFQSTAHEGHGGEGAPLAIKGRHQPGGSPGIISPFTGRPLIEPVFGGLDGLMVTWELAGIRSLQAHGSVDVQPSLPVATDALGATELTFTPRQEAADGRGREAADVAQVAASVDLDELVSHHYAIPAQAMGFIRGRRMAPGLVVVGWHTGGLEVDLTNDYQGVQILLGSGFALGSGKDTAKGFLARLDDGTYRGTLDATVSGSFEGAAIGEACSDTFSGTQKLLAIGTPDAVGRTVSLRFYPASPPSLSTGSCTVPIPFPGGGPDLQPAGSFLPFNDTRWTTQIGFQLDVPQTGSLQYTIPSPSGLQGSSTWDVTVEQVEAGP